jgi:hypothetical protein
VFGGIGFILLVTVALFLFLRRRKQPASNMELEVIGMKDIKDIVIRERVGGGHFADVYRGMWNGVTPVALKKLKNEKQLQDFIKEANVLQYVFSFYPTSKEPQIFVTFQYSAVLWDIY